MTTSDESSEQCSICGANRARLIRLWNERLYCRDCLDERCPQLTEHANRYDVLEETMPFTAWDVVRKQLLFFPLVIMGIFCPILLLVAIAQRDWKVALFGPLFFGPVGALVGLLYGAATAHALKKNRPTFSACANRLIITNPSGNELTACSLDECEWYRGRVSHMSLEVVLPDGPAINIVLPDDADGDETVVAVGYSDDMRQVWDAFLSMADIPRRATWVELSATRRWVDVIAAVLLFPLTLIGTGLLVKLAWEISGLVIANQDVTEAIAFFIGLPGGLSTLCFVYILWPWASWRLVPAKRSTETRRLRTWRGIGVFTVVSVFMFALPALRHDDWNMTARVVYASLAVAWGLGMGWYVGRLTAKYDGVTSRPNPPFVETPGPSTSDET